MARKDNDAYDLRATSGEYVKATTSPAEAPPLPKAKQDREAVERFVGEGGNDGTGPATDSSTPEHLAERKVADEAEES